jgi:hypothetical protein
VIAALLAGAASAAPRLVTSASDAATGTGPLNGTLRYHLTNAGPGDVISFAPAITTLTVGSTTGLALPAITDAGLVIDGGGDVVLACAAALTVGSGLTITANDVVVTGLEIRDCPDHGIQVTAHRVQVGEVGSGNHVHHNDKLGVLVTGVSDNTSDVVVAGNDVHDNCAAPAGVSCAGVGVKKSGSGTAPSSASIHGNEVYAQLGSAPGIALFAGSAHEVVDNIVFGNGGAGISAAAVSGLAVTAALLEGNTSTGNTGPGVLLGTRSSLCVVRDNELDGNGLGAVPAAGLQVSASDDHVLEGNEIGGNGAEGIRVADLLNGSPPERLTIVDNRIGAGGPGNAGPGIRLVGSGTAAVNHVVERNVVANGLADGVVVDAGAVTLTENIVGLDFQRDDPKPNAGAGIVLTANALGAKVDGRIQGQYRPNYVASNLGPGIVSLANNVVIADNVVGWSLDRVSRGNGGDGIWIKAGASAAVRDNVVGNSGGYGVRVEAVGGANPSSPTLNGNAATNNALAGLRVGAVGGVAKWIGNTATDNGTCALSVASTVNGAARNAVPVLERRTGANLRGAYTTAGLTLDHIEVFADPGSEASRFLGTATTSGNNWSFTLAHGDAPLQPDDRVSAVAVFTNGASSRLQEWCGDGCPEPGAASCTDGDDCTTDTCGGSTCVHAPANNTPCSLAPGGCTQFLAGTGFCAAGTCTGVPVYTAADTACVDEDACTTGTTCDGGGHCVQPDPEDVDFKVVCEDGNGCTSEGDCDPALGCPEPERRPVGYVCDDGDLCNTGLGACDEWANCDVDTTPAPCPQDTFCNVCSCDPDDGCVCEGIPNDGWCGPDDFWIDSLGGPDPDCFEPGNPVFDTDRDGFPDLWERNADDIDVNCDGQPDDLIPGSRINSEVFDAEVPNLFWEVDWMAGDTEHDHVPGDYSSIELMFGNEDIVVTIDVDDEVPHARQTIWDIHGLPRELGTWVRFDQAKADWFDLHRRRGVYHYALVGHDLAGSRGTSEVFGDDVTGTSTNVYDDPEGLPPELIGVGLLGHEGGHNLGLQHNGSVTLNSLTPDDPDDVETLGWFLGNDPGDNGEMNHVSNMNYWYGGAGGGLVRWDGVQVHDFARPYPTEVGPRLLNDLDQAQGYDEDHTLWGWQTPIADEFLYHVEWLCPPDFVPGEEVKRSAPIHLPTALRGANPGTMEPGEADLDLNCDDLPGNDVVFTPITKQGNTHHNSFDEWKAIQLDFQRDSRSFSGAGGLPNDEDSGDDRTSRPPAQRPRAELYGGCATPQVPRSGATWLTPVVLFGSADFHAAPLASVTLSGAPSVYSEVRDLDADGWDDLWLEFAPADMPQLHPNAVQVSLYGRRANGREVYATFPITRVTNPPDPDLDGIQTACDACPMQGDGPGPNGKRRPNGCPP